jgi:acyl-CoA thioesterase FadM
LLAACDPVPELPRRFELATPMSLIFRLMIVLVRARFRSPLGVDDLSQITLRVLPNDLDLNFHLNNGRYLTIMDLGRIDFIVRAGLLPTFIRNRWVPVIGGTLVRYRFSLGLFVRFDLTTRFVGWDDKWFYLEQKLATPHGSAAIALAKALVRDGDHTVSPAEVLRSIGIDRPVMPLPEAVRQWLATEQLLREEGERETH